jgi:hypothetical protein
MWPTNQQTTVSAGHSTARAGVSTQDDRVFDSAPGIFPHGAQYAALYADGKFRKAGQFGNIPNRRWITVNGGKDAAAHAGIIDFEAGNPRLHRDRAR